MHWHLGDQGWRFATPEDRDAAGHAVVPDPVAGHAGYSHLRHVYRASDPAYDGRFTVPVLYDTVQQCIVSNESSDILRMLGSEVRFFFSFLVASPPPPSLPRSSHVPARGQFDDLVEDRYRRVELYPEALRGAIDAANAWHYDLINNGVYKAGFATTQAAYDKAVTALFGALDRAEKHLAAGAADGPFWFGIQLTEVDIRL